MTTTEPVRDWGNDYDIFDPLYVREPEGVWKDLRGSCPVAHTDRWGGSWMPTRYEDVRAIAKDVERFSSTEITVVPLPPEVDTSVKAPPITSDPPEHQWARRLILPAFAPGRVDRYESYTRELCRSLLDGFAHRGRVDAAEEYAQQIPPRVIAHLLGVPPEMADTFVEWVRGVLELGLTDPVVRVHYRDKITTFFRERVAELRERPGDDLISELLAAEVDGQPVPDDHIVGTCNLLLVAGIDTTWSSIGSGLWHLATHPEDRARLVDEPELIPTAVEELLRAYSPVTMARIVTEDCEYAGQPAARRRPHLDAVPSSQPRSGDVRGRRRSAHRPCGQSPHRLRCRHPPLRRLQPRAHGDADRAGGVARTDPRVLPRRRRRDDVGRRAGARAPHPPHRVPPLNTDRRDE